MSVRKLATGSSVLVVCLLMMTSSAAAAGEPSCKVKTLPSFMAQGEFGTAATVADVIEVSCNPSVYGYGPIKIVASQLYSRCHNITWYDAGGATGSGISFNTTTDVNGNANVGLIAGPKCMPGESKIVVDQTARPFETFPVSFKVTPTGNTPQGLYIAPSPQVELQGSSSVVTVVQAEFAKSSEQKVRLGYGQLNDSCEKGSKTTLVRENRTTVVNMPEAAAAIELDNNGNGFALMIGNASCAPGLSMFEAEVERAPHPLVTAWFTVEGPHQRF